MGDLASSIGAGLGVAIPIILYLFFGKKIMNFLRNWNPFKRINPRH